MDYFVCKKCSCTTFYTQGQRKIVCTECHKVRMRKYYQSASYKELNRKRMRHGNHDWRQTLQEMQGDCCAICEAKFVETPHLDHNHVTNKLRALLCVHCNIGLGAFKDDPKLLLKAVIYLTTFDAEHKLLQSE